MTLGERRARRKMAINVGLDTDGHRITEAALALLDRPWNPRESTAQPPAVCGHSVIQYQRDHRPPRYACAACGHETGPR